MTESRVITLLVKRGWFSDQYRQFDRNDVEILEEEKDVLLNQGLYFGDAITIKTKSGEIVSGLTDVTIPC